MAAKLAAKRWLLVKRIILLQGVAAIMCALLGAVFLSPDIAISVALGGIVGVLPNILFGFFAFRHIGARHNKQVVKNFSQGSKLKFLTTILLFVAVFQWPNLTPLALLAGYIVIVAIQWPYFIYLARVESDLVQ